MKKHGKRRTCKTCMWGDQCPAREICEDYYNPQADMDMELGMEDSAGKREEFYAQWERLAKEHDFFSDM